ncbi:hypothetical protein VTI74DRAFT_6387 [Chaetomium olivicolor]
MSETEQSTKKYRGNCHCGAFVFEVEVPEIKTVSDCNCSICTKRGYLWLVPQKPLNVVKNEGKLVHYSFASKNMDHQFCGHCGTTVMATSEMFPAKVGINARTLQDLDIWSLELKTFEGNKFDPKYVAPEYSGPEPNPPGYEDGKTYYGSCHCGAVTTAVKVKGSLEDGTYGESIMECNCSHCQRIGYVWIYPAEPQVAIHGRENLSYYAFGRRVWRKAFCKTCGVNIGAGPDPNLTDDVIATLPEDVQKFLARMGHKRPINTRILNGFDVKCLKPIRGDGWNLVKPAYVNP